MRALILVLIGSLVVPGCIGPDYYLTAESVTYRFTHETYNVTRARAGLDAANLTHDGPRSPTYLEGSLEGTHGDTRGYVNPLPNGSIELTISFLVNEHTGTREKAEARGLELSLSRAADANRILVAFENATGWTHNAGPMWHAYTLHGD